MRDKIESFFLEKIGSVDLKALELALDDGRIPSESVAELAMFGQLLVTSIEQRIEHRKGRAISIVGWSLAALGFLMVGGGSLGGMLIWVIGFFALLAMLLGVAASWRERLSWFGLPTWFWTEPDSADFGNLESADRLRRVRVFQLAEVYLSLARANANKSTLLLLAEISMLICGAVLFAGITRLV